jgi:hypothetical protein
MKKLGFLTSLMMIFSMCISPVYALENETPYFTNMNGVELTKTQYDNLLKGFGEDTINTMTQTMINSLKNDTNIVKTTSVKYIKTDTIYVDEKVISKSEAEVSKQEYDNSPKGKPIITPIISPMYSGNTGNPTHETTYKKLSIDITWGIFSYIRHVTLTNVWKQIPAIKSFDVLAIAPGHDSISFNIDGNRSGYQKWDGNTINYDTSSGNWKIVNGSGIYKKGLGLSQNIVDDVTTSLSNSITVTFITDVIPFTARGSYQHATSNLTLTQSQNYTLATDGMGGLIKFNSSVAGYYDDMQGVQTTLNLP